MRKEDNSRKIANVAGLSAAKTGKFQKLHQDSPLVSHKNAGFLTSLIGTQPLLTATAPAYPIIKIV